MTINPHSLQASDEAYSVIVINALIPKMHEAVAPILNGHGATNIIGATTAMLAGFLASAYDSYAARIEAANDAAKLMKKLIIEN